MMAVIGMLYMVSSLVRFWCAACDEYVGSGDTASYHTLKWR
jgi:hypothetical protein